mgnify:CR=1 FL=1
MCLGPRPAAGLQGGVEGGKEEVGAAGEAGDKVTRMLDDQTIVLIT